MLAHTKTAALISEPLHVDLWSLRLPTSLTPDDVAQLSPTERDRAGRLHRESDRLAFISARAALRRCLSGRLGQPPDKVRIDSRRGVKPTFPDLPPTTDLSLSHASGQMLIAICDGARVGVDIEMETAVDLDLAETVCSRQELASLTLLPVRDRRRAFARLWTRKEAITKATGVGFAGDPTMIEVSIDARPRLVRWDAEEVADWEMICPPIGPAWAATIAVEARARPLVVRQHLSA